MITNLKKPSIYQKGTVYVVETTISYTNFHVIIVVYIFHVFHYNQFFF